MTSYLSLPLDSRLKSNSRWEPEADPGSDLDPDPALLHLHAHVGGRGRRGRQETDPQTASAGLDPEQGAPAPHHQLPPGLEGRQGPGSSGGQLCPW